MRKRIKDILWFTIENGPTILTIGFAAYVIGLAEISSVTTDVTLSWILAILGLLAMSELVERLRKLGHIEKVTDEVLEVIRSRFVERARAEDYFMDHLPPLGPFFEKAIDIRMSGVVLQRTIRDNIQVLARCLREGAAMKVMLIDPRSDAAKRTADEHFPLERLQAHFDATWQNLIWLANLPDCKGTLEVRLACEEFYHNTIAINPDKEFGIIFIELRPQRWLPGGSRPRFKLLPERDGYWYAYYQDQFDRLWCDCKPVKVDREK